MKSKHSWTLLRAGLALSAISACGGRMAAGFPEKTAGKLAFFFSKVPVGESLIEVAQVVW